MLDLFTACDPVLISPLFFGPFGSRQNRTKEVVLARVLAEAEGCVVIKRSADETHVNARNRKGEVAPLKIFNQRAFIRYGVGPAQQSRVVIPGVELLGTDALALVEAFERPLHSLELEQLREHAQRVQWFLMMYLGDSLAANKLAFRISSRMMPDALIWFQRCDAHQCAITTLRPMEAQDTLKRVFIVCKLIFYQVAFIDRFANTSLNLSSRHNF